jgi:hypothetical protein
MKSEVSTPEDIAKIGLKVMYSLLFERCKGRRNCIEFVAVFGR